MIGVSNHKSAENGLLSLRELAEKVGITNANLFKIKTGRIAAIRFSLVDRRHPGISKMPHSFLSAIGRRHNP